MNLITTAKTLGPQIRMFIVENPRIAKKCEPGQFVIVRSSDDAERIPLTIADFDREKGMITLIVQEVGKGSQEICQMEEGDSFSDIAGPLGHSTEVKNFGTVICVGGGIGIAPIFPIARAWKEAGNHVISIIGARTKELLIWEDEMRSVSSELIVTTDDGSHGRAGRVTDPLREILEKDEVARVMAIGPVIMMKFVAETTRPFGTPTWASLNPVMVDGTGMCGGCRVTVGNEVYFACVDGPEFDAHKIDFDGLMARQKMFATQEDEAKKCCGGTGACKTK